MSFFNNEAMSLCLLLQALKVFVIQLINAIGYEQIGKAEISPEVHGAFLRSMHIAFMIFAILCFGGIFASVARGRMIVEYHQS